MSVLPTGSATPAHTGDTLLSNAQGAQALFGERSTAAGLELARSPALGIDDETRARAVLLVRGAIHTAERALRAAEPMLDVGLIRTLADRFVGAGLLSRSGLASAALLRADEHRLTAALVRGATGRDGPAVHRLDPIGGEFVEESFAVRAAEAARIERTGDPILPLQDLSAEDRHALFWQAAACLTDEAIRNGVAEDVLHRAAIAAVGRTLAAIDDDEGIAATTLRLAHRLADAGQLDDALLAGTLAAGRVASLAAMLAVRAGIGFEDARAMLADTARCAVLLRACEVERSIAAAMIIALSLALDRGFGPDPMDGAAGLIDGYDRLPVEQARHEVRRARLEPIYRDALSILAVR